MTVTLTSNYREVLAPETVDLIEMYERENYDLRAMLVFIDENSEVAFQDLYPEYVEIGEEYGFESLDAWIRHTSPADLVYFRSAYIGEYLNPRDMAVEYFEDDESVNSLDYRVVIDWAETAEYLLAHEVDRVGDFYFRCHY